MHQTQELLLELERDLLPQGDVHEPHVWRNGAIEPLDTLCNPGVVGV